MATDIKRTYILISANYRGHDMAIFKVKHDYDHGRWISDHQNPVVEVDAPNAKTAAEIVCSTALREGGTAGNYRAQVWPLGGVRYAHQIAHFYSA